MVDVGGTGQLAVTQSTQTVDGAVSTYCTRVCRACAAPVRGPDSETRAQRVAVGPWRARGPVRTERGSIVV